MIGLRLLIVTVVGLISNSTGDVVDRIKNRYNSVPEKCFDALNKEKPAYECSGILIRGVRTDIKLPYAWAFKNSDLEKDSFALAYLRSDQVFSEFPRDYDSGYIVYPHLETPSGKNKYKVFCSFPLDAHTDNREGRGCGKSRSDRAHGSDQCHKQNIKSLANWKSHFHNIMNSGKRNFVVRQCGFDMTKREAATYFDISLKANRYIQSHSTKYAFRNNELRMHKWSVNGAKHIPIEAFFYLIDSPNGKTLAEKYQDSFFAQSGGEKVPIVGIRLPTAQRNFEIISHIRTPQQQDNEHLDVDSKRSSQQLDIWTPEQGVDIVNRIKNRYNNVPEKCFNADNNEKPAYECSGILIRAVRADLAMDYGWAFKNTDLQRDAFSLAYLRSDQVFSEFPRDYDSGYIVYPHLEAPSGKNKYKVFCSFPIDAHTDNREGHGCGKSRSDRAHGSDNCHKQNIKSLANWKSHFNNIMNSGNKNFVVRQCGFDMTKNEAATYFGISLKANRYIKSFPTEYSFRNNELRMRKWSISEAKNIPIEAFFYLIDSPNGKTLAEKYQDTFYARSGGEKVPIVGIRLPSAQTNFEIIFHARTPQPLNI